MLCPYHSLLPVHADKYLYVICKHLYDKNLNNEQEESIRNLFCSVMYLRVPSVQDLCFELLREI